MPLPLFDEVHQQSHIAIVHNGRQNTLLIQYFQRVGYRSDPSKTALVLFQVMSLMDSPGGQRQQRLLSPLRMTSYSRDQACIVRLIDDIFALIPHSSSHSALNLNLQGEVSFKTLFAVSRVSSLCYTHLSLGTTHIAFTLLLVVDSDLEEDVGLG